MLGEYYREVKSTQEPFREAKADRCRSQKKDWEKHYKNERHTQQSKYFTVSLSCLLMILKVVRLEINTYNT